MADYGKFDLIDHRIEADMTAKEDPALPSPADQVRQLMRSCGKAGLATLDAETGEPYNSLVLVVADCDASPLMMLSDLADHTTNLKKNPQASLLLDGDRHAETLASQRVSVQGHVSVINDQALIDRFVARHPEAAIYAGFKDFNLYRLSVTRAHLIGGFGRIHWLEASDIMADSPRLDEAAEEIITHMNEDHADAIAAYVHDHHKTGDAWRMIGIDTDGIDLSNGEDYLRINTPERMLTPGDSRRALAKMAKRARGE
jgi:putative heme iron utilization protein